MISFASDQNVKAVLFFSTIFWSKIVFAKQIAKPFYKIEIV